MTKPQRFHVFLFLSLTCVPALDSRAQQALTRTEALGALMTYQGPVQRLHATFPQAVTNTPPLTSMGPISVSQDCYSGWRAAMNELRQEGYLTSFQDVGGQIALTPSDLTAKGKAFFAHLTAGSVYCRVRLIPGLAAADVRIGDVKISANRKRAEADFRKTLSEPFRIMRANGLFAAGCGADMDPAVATDGATVAGHAHFRFRKGRWQAERVLLGEHRADEE